MPSVRDKLKEKLIPDLAEIAMGYIERNVWRIDVNHIMPSKWHSTNHKYTFSQEIAYKAFPFMEDQDSDVPFKRILIDNRPKKMKIPIDGLVLPLITYLKKIQEPC